MNIYIIKGGTFMANNISQEEEKRIKEMIDDLVERAKKASKEYLKLDQETVNKVIKAMSLAGLEHHMELAKMAVEETGNNKEYVCNRICLS